MSSAANAPLDEKKEAARFLECDFNQCFEQMRHYDGQTLDVVKFAVTAYGLIAGAALAFYRYGLDNSVDYRAPALAIIIVGLLLGVTLLTLVTRNRTYFVLVARYVNEHRAFYLKDEPLGFPNQTRMYANPKQPPYFNWRSSEALLLYSLALLNAGLLGVGLYLAFEAWHVRWGLIAAAPGIFFVLQVGSAVAYLVSREGKSASRAVFGQE